MTNNIEESYFTLFDEIESEKEQKVLSEIDAQNKQAFIIPQDDEEISFTTRE